MSLYLTRRRALPVRRPVLLDDPFFASPLHRELDRVFDALWAETFRAPARRRPTSLPLAVDEDDEALTLKLALDGFQPADLSLELHDDVLVITGDTERSAAVDVDDAGTEEPVEATDDTEGERLTVQRPRARRTFRKAWRLDPERYVLDDIDARVKDGTLSLTVPRVRPPEPRTIEVRVD